MYTLLIDLGVPTILTGIFCYFAKKYITRKERKLHEQETLKMQSELLTLQCICASLALGEATAKAIKNGKCNGEMSEALSYANETKHKLQNFIEEQGIRKIY